MYNQPIRLDTDKFTDVSYYIKREGLVIYEWMGNQPTITAAIIAHIYNFPLDKKLAT